MEGEGIRERGKEETIGSASERKISLCTCLLLHISMGQREQVTERNIRKT